MQQTLSAQQTLIRAGRILLIEPSCPLCRQPNDAGLHGLPCPACRTRLALPSRGLVGEQPLPWKALGLYRNDFRALLLKLRRRPDRRSIQSLIQLLSQIIPQGKGIALVPIPGWKKQHANPWPQRICSNLQKPVRPLLQRCRASAGQHQLTRYQRFRNLQGSFRAEPAKATNSPMPMLWMVDDILTTGATALSARDALTQAGHRVAGMICLARTPHHRR